MAQLVERPSKRFGEFGATLMTWVRFPVVAKELGQLLMKT